MRRALFVLMAALAASNGCEEKRAPRPSATKPATAKIARTLTDLKEDKAGVKTKTPAVSTAVKAGEPKAGYAPYPAPWVAPRMEGGQVRTACTYRFYHVADEKEGASIKTVIERHAVDKEVRMSRGQDGNGAFVEYQFILNNAEDIAKLNSALPWRELTVEGKVLPSLAYEQVDAQYFASYRTAPLRGTLETIVRFRVTPGASLFYSLKRGTETPVPREQIDGTGSVAFAIRIPPGQQYVYGHSVLGAVHSFLRISVETGQEEEIDRATYENR